MRCGGARCVEPTLEGPCLNANARKFTTTEEQGGHRGLDLPLGAAMTRSSGARIKRREARLRAQHAF